MTVRPIIFSTPMVQALLAGRKTQTRRLASSPLRRVEVGDLLWVREAFTIQQNITVLTNQGTMFEICIDMPADGRRTWFTLAAKERKPAWRRKNDSAGKAIGRPAMFFPRPASRLTLEVTEVRRMRLQDTSARDCQAEGHPSCPELSPDPEVHLDAARDWFMDLWDGLHTKPGERWADNPEIIALTFRVHHGNVDALAKRCLHA